MVDATANDALIALGANLPHIGNVPSETLSLAIKDLASAGLTVTAQSRFYATPCFPPGAGPDYVNAAARLRPPPGMTPEEVLAILHRIERAHGRERVRRWGMRTLDLDLIAWGGRVWPDRPTWDRWFALSPEDQAEAAPDRLILPHPRMQDRAFVLVPLADVAPDWSHPILGQTTTGLLAALPAADRAEVRPI